MKTNRFYDRMNVVPVSYTHLKSYLNTILYTVVGTIVALVINIPAGYALSRKDLFAKKDVYKRQDKPYQQ